MRTYFDEASQGVVDTQLFFVMLKSNFEEILDEAFEEEMILLTMGKVSSKNWLLDPKALMNHVDLKLLELIDENRVEDALDCIKQPQKSYEDVILNLIDKECPDGDRVGSILQSSKNGHQLGSFWIFGGRFRKSQEIHRGTAASRFPKRIPEQFSGQKFYYRQRRIRWLR